MNTDGYLQTRREFLKHTASVASLALGGCLAANSSRRLTAPKPNIIVIMADDMGYSGLSCYGNKYCNTPETDRLAVEGMRFTDSHSSGVVCSPTRAGLLTGRYQQRAGIEAVIHPRLDHPEHRKGLQPTEITFAHALKDAGYATGLIGKWHLGYATETPKYHPLNHDFDYFVGYLSGNIDYASHYGDHNEHDWWHGRTEVQEEGYTTHLINKYALQFIEENRDKPFCLYVAHEAIHDPIQGPGDPPERGPARRENPTPPDVAYQRMTQAMDEGVGQIRRKVVDLGLDKNTLIFFFSDNGGNGRARTNSARYAGAKGAVWEGGHRVPAIAWWPGMIKPRSVTDEMAISIDLMPTMLALAGASVPIGHALDGIDLSPVLFERKQLPSRQLFWAHLGNNGQRMEAVRDDQWKLIVTHPSARPGTFQNEKLILYNLKDDPGEKTDLINEHPDLAKKMLAELKQWYAEVTNNATFQPGGWSA